MFFYYISTALVDRKCLTSFVSFRVGGKPGWTIENGQFSASRPKKIVIIKSLVSRMLIYNI